MVKFQEKINLFLMDFNKVESISVYIRKTQRHCYVAYLSKKVVIDKKVKKLLEKEGKGTTEQKILFLTERYRSKITDAKIKKNNIVTLNNFFQSFIQILENSNPTEKNASLLFQKLIEMQLPFETFKFILNKLPKVCSIHSKALLKPFLALLKFSNINLKFLYVNVKETKEEKTKFEMKCKQSPNPEYYVNGNEQFVIETKSIRNEKDTLRILKHSEITANESIYIKNHILDRLMNIQAGTSVKDMPFEFNILKEVTPICNSFYNFFHGGMALLDFDIERISTDALSDPDNPTLTTFEPNFSKTFKVLRVYINSLFELMNLKETEILTVMRKRYDKLKDWQLRIGKRIEKPGFTPTEEVKTFSIFLEDFEKSPMAIWQDQVDNINQTRRKLLNQEEFSKLKPRSFNSLKYSKGTQYNILDFDLLKLNAFFSKTVPLDTNMDKEQIDVTLEIYHSIVFYLRENKKRLLYVFSIPNSRAVISPFLENVISEQILKQQQALQIDIIKYLETKKHINSLKIHQSLGFYVQEVLHEFLKRYLFYFDKSRLLLLLNTKTLPFIVKDIQNGVDYETISLELDTQEYFVNKEQISFVEEIYFPKFKKLRERLATSYVGKSSTGKEIFKTVDLKHALEEFLMSEKEQKKVFWWNFLLI